ncbi:MAG: T9SS type A sorting domain-containing protein [Bacteroidota bacterium]
MRLVTAFFLLTLCAGSLVAQPCDPAATEEACADTTDWKRYFPLEVGNVWHYYEDLTEEPENRWSWSITGEAEAGGETYVSLERCDDNAAGAAVCEAPVLLRYDDEHDMIVRRTESGDVWWRQLPCLLSADFNVGYACTGPGTGDVAFSSVFGAYGATRPVPPDVLSGDTEKDFVKFPGTGAVLYAGLGATAFPIELQGNAPKLVYAHVGGEQVGTPAFASCDPTDLEDDEVCPDTTDWRRYFPLEVGNQWQYEYEGFCNGVFTCKTGQEVVGTERIEGVDYFLIRSCEVDDGTSEVSCSDPVPRRYAEEGDPVDDPRLITPCLFDLPFNFQDEVACSEVPEAAWFTSGRYGSTFGLDEGPSLQGTVKEIGNIGAFATYFAGIGQTRYLGDGNLFGTNLVYAQIGGVEYGTPAFAFPTSGEGEAAPLASGFTSLFPNPSSRTATARYTLGAAQVVTLEVVDLLGRRVHTVEAGPQTAGAHEVAVETQDLPAGVYLLRLRGGEGVLAVQRLSVVR